MEDYKFQLTTEGIVAFNNFVTELDKDSSYPYDAMPYRISKARRGLNRNGKLYIRSVQTQMYDMLPA